MKILSYLFLSSINNSVREVVESFEVLEIFAKSDRIIDGSSARIEFINKKFNSDRGWSRNVSSHCFN